MKQKYMEPSVPNKLMEGLGSPQPTIFGVIGKTKIDNYTKSLGNIVYNTKLTPYKDPAFKPGAVNTENGILGHNATHIAKQHYGQVPYAGRFMAKVGGNV